MQSDLTMWALLLGSVFLLAGGAAFCGALGFRTGKKFKANPGQTASQRFFRSFAFWCPVSVLAFPAIIVLAMMNLTLVAIALTVPATYLFAIAIELDPGFNRPRSRLCNC